MKPLAVRTGIALILTGVVLFVGSLTAVGEAQSWDRADAFAAQSSEPVHRLGLILGVLGVAALIATSPALVAFTYRTRGFATAVAGWIGFAFGMSLFLMVYGLVTIALPALAELAARGDVSPQRVVDQFVRQPAILLGFLGANAAYLSWAVLGAGLARSGHWGAWTGWTSVAGALAGWLGFLHVPIFQSIGGPAWAVSILLLGVQVVRSDLRDR